MNRELFNLALIVGIIVFLGALLFEFALSPAPRPVRSLAGTPVERSLERIDAEVQQRRIDHRAWQTVANSLLEADDPYAALVELDARLGDEAQRAVAATGFAAYYLGYHLMLRSDPAAGPAFEYGLASFREHRGHERPWLGGYDELYLARTLMRLDRDAEALEVLEAIEPAESEANFQAELTYARTLAEVGDPDRASRRLVRLVESQPVNRLPRAFEDLIDTSGHWQGSLEPRAARAALDAALRIARDRLDSDEPAPEWMTGAMRELGLAYADLDRPELAREVWTLAERASEALARTQSDARAWRSVARLRALLGDTPGAARALERGSAYGDLSANELVYDQDLRRFMHLPDMRAAVRRYGEPDAWPEDLGPPGPNVGG